MMKAESLVKQYGAVRSLDAVTVTIDDGSILGLIGSNGSGKSTFLRLLCGILKPDGGCVLYDGSNLWENTDAKAKLLYVSDEPFFLPHSSLIEMSALYESIYPSYSRERFAELAALFSLDTRRKINTFSRGMQKQAAILLALAVRPKCLLLDETFDGLDPVMRQMVKRLLAEDVAERGMSVVLASHNLRELEDICDRVALLHAGRLLFQRELDDMKLTIQKIQAVFTETDAESALAALPLLNLERRGSVYTIVARGTKEELDAKMRELSPQFYEFIPLTLEEIFISEMGDRGYDFTKLLA